MSKLLRTAAAVSAFATVTLMSAAPAYADPVTTTLAKSAFKQWTQDHALLIVIGWGALILVVAGIALSSDNQKEQEQRQKRQAQRRAAQLAAGRRLAVDAGASPDAQSPEDLQRYAAFHWAVPWQPGTAFGNLVDRRGSYPRLSAAWIQACELARIGHWDDEGVFTPAAVIANVNGYGDDSGDLELSVNTADYTVGERELNRVLDHLVRTARVETASKFTRNAVKDWHVTRLSMNDPAGRPGPGTAAGSTRP
ncbi:hypothetical protein [Mycolicibacterium llatzerense]|uniref:hypothetical protein n=1 Tax=Mycolicibacterium llatzerense TaxID=280871 RepID=UPI0008DD1965|nr:hypothetical protein [Mycolicibacterium llatzerense]